MLIRAATEADVPGILAIYNDAVLRTTAVWNETPSDLEGRLDWFRSRTGAGFPVVVAVEGTLVEGYASFGPFRPFEGYRGSVEHSVYVRAGARGRGLGRALMEALFPLARAMGKRVMIGGIDGSNEASLALHARLGFREVGRLPGVGEKFGDLLDLVFMQKELAARPRVVS
jgi:phosphinothricin acetyltransferase